MNFFYKITVLLLSLKFSYASHNCSVIEDRKLGYGCELTHLTPEDEVAEINLSGGFHENLGKDDVEWIRISHSELRKLPTGMFDEFVNLEQILIVNTWGFSHLNVSYFDKRVKAIAMHTTDIEVIGEQAFRGLALLNLLNLNSNGIKKIHKNAFADLEHLEKIELNDNQISALDDEIFGKNFQLKIISLSGNQLTMITAQLMLKNTKLEIINFKRNELSQIEKDFQKSFVRLVTADFTSNVCVSRKFELKNKMKLPSYGFEECNKNFALMKQTNKVIDKLEENLKDVEQNVSLIEEKVGNDMKVLEGRMKNSTAMEEIKTDLVNFFENDKQEIRKNFKKQLNDIAGEVKTEMEKKVERELERKLAERQEAQEKKLVHHHLKEIHDETDRQFTVVYILLFVIASLILVINVFLLRRVKLFPKLRYHDNKAELLSYSS